MTEAPLKRPVGSRPYRAFATSGFDGLRSVVSQIAVSEDNAKRRGFATRKSLPQTSEPGA